MKMNNFAKRLEMARASVPEKGKKGRLKIKSDFAWKMKKRAKDDDGDHEYR